MESILRLGRGEALEPEPCLPSAESLRLVAALLGLATRRRDSLRSFVPLPHLLVAPSKALRPSISDYACHH